MGKLSLAPISPALCRLQDAPLRHPDRDDALRGCVAAFFEEHGGTWKLRVHLCRDLETMPIEDASVPWPEERSPYLAVARLHLPRQTS